MSTLRAKRRRGPRRDSQMSQIIWGVVAAVLGIGLLGAMGAFYFWAKGNQVALDAANCPVTGPKGIHVILIDRSDPITPVQSERVRQVVEGLVSQAQTGERFDLYVADGDGINLLIPTVSVCSSGRGATASALYENPEAIERSFQERFVTPLRQAMGELLVPTSRATSPLLESLRTIAVTSFGAAPQAERHLTVVSDLIQHSPAVSHFRGETDFEVLQRQQQWAQLRPNLTGAEVRVLYLLRPSARRRDGRPIQTLGHQQFWKDLFEATGVVRLNLESI